MMNNINGAKRSDWIHQYSESADQMVTGTTETLVQASRGVVYPLD